MAAYQIGFRQAERLGDRNCGRVIAQDHHARGADHITLQAKHRFQRGGGRRVRRETGQIG